MEIGTKNFLPFQDVLVTLMVVLDIRAIVTQSALVDIFMATLTTNPAKNCYFSKLYFIQPSPFLNQKIVKTNGII